VATLEERFRAGILTTAVAAFVGNRCYDRQAPPNPTYPLVRYQRVSTIRLYSQENDAALGGVGWARFQVDCISDTPNGGIVADQLAVAITASLQTFNLWNQPASPVVVQSAPNTVLNQRSGIEPQTQQPLFKVMLDIKVWFSEQ
jgi:hypothetical protein